MSPVGLESTRILTDYAQKSPRYWSSPLDIKCNLCEHVSFLPMQITLNKNQIHKTKDLFINSYAHHNRSISCVKIKSTTVPNIQNCVEYPWINKGQPNCTCQCGCSFHLWHEAISTCPTTLLREPVPGSHMSSQFWSTWIIPHSRQHQKLGIVSSLDVILHCVFFNH